MCQVYCKTKCAHNTVRIMETDTVFGSYPIPIPLSLTQLQTCLCKLCICCTTVHGCLNCQMRFGYCLSRNALELERILMNGFDSRGEGFSTFIMTFKARFIDSLQRARHPVRCIFTSVLTYIRHVAVHTGYSRIRMDTRDPCFKIRMLCFEHWCLGICMNPILLEASRLPRLIELEFGLGIIPVVIRHINASVFLGEIIFSMALRTDISTHIVMGCSLYVDTATCHGINKAHVVNT